jgi:hypothetical protein
MGGRVSPMNVSGLSKIECGKPHFSVVVTTTRIPILHPS